MDIESLKEIGLTDIEIKIYIMLLREGTSLASDISKKTGIHRRTIYDSIERLIQKGLISYIKTNNRKYFEAVDPSRLSEILKEKEENINKIIPELEKIRIISKENKETLFFRGKQALRSLFDDQIKVGKEILILGNEVNVNDILKYYFPKFDKERIRKKIPIRMIFDESSKKNKELRKIPLAKLKFIDKKDNSNMSIYVYGNNTAIVNWSENPNAILIKEKSISDGFRGYFEFMWGL